jgi:hypothetical protein
VVGILSNAVVANTVYQKLESIYIEPFFFIFDGIANISPPPGGRSIIGLDEGFVFSFRFFATGFLVCVLIFYLVVVLL